MSNMCNIIICISNIWRCIMNRIAELRKEMNLNQVGLALKLNVSQYMISAYETGRHQPTADMLTMIADYFNVSVDYLLGRSNIRSIADNMSKDNFIRKRTGNAFSVPHSSKREKRTGNRYCFCYKKYVMQQQTSNISK